MSDAPSADRPDTAAVLRAMPKVELHCHLEGSVPAPAFIELAGRHGLTLPTTDPERVYDFESFLGFLDLLGLVCASMVTVEDFERATYDSLAWAAEHGNVCYREMFWNPTNHTTSYPDQVEGIVAGLEAAEADLGVRGVVLAGINRRHAPAAAVELVESIVAHPHERVIGIGLDDDEDSGPPEMFAGAYALGGRHGLRRTAHAGELGVAANVAASLDVLGCERIDHGYAMVGHDDVVGRIVDEGVHVTGAWFVNLFHHGVPGGADPTTSPLATMLATEGLSVSLNTDDPTMIPTDLSAEMIAVHETLGLGLDRLVRCQHDAIDGAFCDDAERRVLRDRFDTAVAELRTAHDA